MYINMQENERRKIKDKTKERKKEDRERARADEEREEKKSTNNKTVKWMEKRRRRRRRRQITPQNENGYVHESRLFDGYGLKLSFPLLLRSLLNALRFVSATISGLTASGVQQIPYVQYHVETFYSGNCSVLCLAERE